MESEITTLLNSRSEVIRTKDVDQLMSYYSSDIIYFDIVPPLQYVGSAALRHRFLKWFDGYESGIRQDIRDLNIVANENIAITSMLIRSGGTLKNGREVGLWVRATSCFKRLDRKWMITHEHISAPVDLQNGSAILDLVP